jgi:hypothetical protein
MRVWGVWQEGAFWFSSSHRSRRARNLATDAGCVVATKHAAEPMVVEGHRRADHRP